MNNLEEISQRPKGQFSISIATSLALEGAFGIYPERPETPEPISKAKEIWFNIRTLIRNIFNSLSNDLKNKIMIDDLHITVVEEMKIIETIILQKTTNINSIVFYLPDYSRLKLKFPQANLRISKTEKQIMYEILENETAKLLIKNYSQQDFRVFNYEINGNYEETFIVTHYPVDLLSRYSFKRLDLLESHTGKIKSYLQWYTKLNGSQNFDNIPFNRFTLQVFGDGVQFTGLLPSLKKEILEIAKEDRWTLTTTNDKIKNSLKKIKDDSDRTLLLSLM